MPNEKLMHTGEKRAVAKPAVSFEQKKQMKLAALWSAIWEASQYLTETELSDHCESVVREVEADA